MSKAKGALEDAGAHPAQLKHFVEVKARMQALEHDITALKDYLRGPFGGGDVGVRIAACALTCSQLQTALWQMQIAALGAK
jgi:hypothetical protein